MNLYKTKLDLLIDISFQKKDEVSIILNICENQHTLLTSTFKSDDILAYFKVLSDEKQNVVNTILSLDDAFNSNYEQCKDAFADENKDNYSCEIKTLQKIIASINDITSKISLVEKSNELFISKHSAHKTNAKNLEKLYNTKNIFND
ncbi:MAG: hypothetical protein ACK5LV_11480 [Lachnospirales bacterium]